MAWIPPDAALPWVSAIAWCYLVTNLGRIVTYVPQIVAVWRCTEGARAISLLTWTSWVVSHAAAVLYGAVVMVDTLFVVVSLVNLLCCAAVTLIAAHRRGLWPASAGVVR